MLQLLFLCLFMSVLASVGIGVGAFFENLLLVGFGVFFLICTLFTAYKIGEKIGTAARMYVDREINEFLSNK